MFLHPALNSAVQLLVPRYSANMGNSRLSKTFNLPTQESLDEIAHEIEISIPENAELRDIVKLALTAYKTQIESINNIEPQYRTRYFEIAQLYLQNAMDAIEADRELQIKSKKLEYDLNKKSGLPDGQKILLEGGKTREELLKKLTDDRRKLN